VQFSVIADVSLVPLHVWGPLSVTCPAAVTLPVNPSKGGANASVQPACVTTAVLPTRLASQCLVTVQSPLRFAQLAPADAPLPPPAAPAEESDVPELHPQKNDERTTHSTRKKERLTMALGIERRSEKHKS
jgi:hypothetical protein